MPRPPRLDRSRLRTRTREGEPRRFSRDLAARPVDPAAPFRAFAAGLPDALMARDLKAVARALARARAGGRMGLAMVGAHVVKTGCAPLLLDLMERRVITALAMNGATAIHDFELACFGDTSEDVGEGLKDGSFGMWEETGAWMNAAAVAAAEAGQGLGEGLGHALLERRPPHVADSLLAAAARLEMPATVHVALGTDIIHQHPAADGAALGKTSLADLDQLAGVLQGAEQGVVLNLGSAVVLPEVFLKALTMARNAGGATGGLTLANFDMLAHYRPRANVLDRPAKQCGGQAYQILGPHELLLPLLHGLVLAELV